MDDEWTDPSEIPNPRSTRRDRDGRARRLGRRQDQLISTTQLARLGFPAPTVHDRIRSGRLHPTPFSGVVALSVPPLSRRQTIRAAVMSCGPGSLASHWAAAEIMRIVESPPVLPIHVIRPGGNGRSGPNVALHRSHVPPADTAAVDGLFCTSAARTIVDLAAIAEPDDLEDVLIAADSLGILNHRRLDELLEPAVRRRGARKLRALLTDGPIRVNSRVEITMLRICRDAGLPPPMVNGRIAAPGCTFEVDFHWPSLRLVVEVDGYRFHGGRRRANVDRDRDQRLTIAGWTVVRFTRDQVESSPALVARRLRELVIAAAQ